jgi:hypothetical protein
LEIGTIRAKTAGETTRTKLHYGSTPDQSGYFQPENEKEMERTKDNLTGIQCALVVLSFYRVRNLKRPRFKRARKLSNRTQMVSCRYEMVRQARSWINRAREKGWSGGIREWLTASERR